MSIWIISTSTLHAAPGDTLFSEDFDIGLTTCDTLTTSFTTTDTNLSGVNTLTANSGSCSLSTLGGAVTVTSTTIDLSGITGAQLTAWVRKGADTFSEDPDNAGENLVLEYIDTTGFWVTL